MSDWQQVFLADVIEIISGGTPKTSVKSYWDGGIPWLTVSDFNTGYRWVDSAEKSISERGLLESAAVVLDAGDVIISARGTVGVVAQLAANMSFNQSCYGVRGKVGVTDTDYIYYTLRHSVSKMRQVSHGAVFSTITRDTFKYIDISLPPLPEQRAIAHILGSLDDKIEANRRQNETLEAIARAIFRSWFVDFDPVHAKARGEQPAGMDAATAALFPDRFEDSALGPIPAGWRVGTIGDLCRVIQNGGTPQRSEELYWDWGTIPWYKTGELSDGPLIDSEERITELGLSRSSCKLWPENTVLIALYASPTVGRLGILTSPSCANQACSALIAKAEYGELFLFQTLLNERERLQRYAVGAAQQNISQQVVREHTVLIPSPHLTQEYQAFARSLYSVVEANMRQSRTLAELRDALLPKLVSGEIRVGGVE
jgi:type I restriction enzyme, S subunit